MVEHPKSKSTRPRCATTRVTLYFLVPVRLRAPIFLTVLLRDEADEGRHLLVHEAAEADPKVAGDVADGGGELAAELDHVLPVVRHGVGEVHEVVDVDGVLLGGDHPETDPGLLSRQSITRSLSARSVCDQSDPKLLISKVNSKK